MPTLLCGFEYSDVLVQNGTLKPLPILQLHKK